MSAIGILVSVITSAPLIALFLLAVRYQFYSKEQVPHWAATRLQLVRRIRLFSPNPARSDVHLIAREFGRDGVPTSCREVPMIQARHWTHTFWNPTRRRSLSLLTLLPDVTAISTRLGEDRAAIVLTTPYLILLGIVSSQAAADARACQFLLVERFGYEPDSDAEVVFCSAVHRLDRPESRSVSL